MHRHTNWAIYVEDNCKHHCIFTIDYKHAFGGRKHTSIPVSFSFSWGNFGGFGSGLYRSSTNSVTWCIFFFPPIYKAASVINQFVCFGTQNTKQYTNILTLSFLLCFWSPLCWVMKSIVKRLNLGISSKVGMGRC